MPVLVPTPAEYVALGAAAQAAWALSGSSTPPDWKPAAMTQYDATPTPEVRERYAQVRDLTEGFGT